MLARADGAVLARSDIAAALWGAGAGRLELLDPHVSRLRRKLVEAGLPRDALRTWRSRGLALNVPL